MGVFLLDWYSHQAEREGQKIIRIERWHLSATTFSAQTVVIETRNYQIFLIVIYWFRQFYEMCE